MKHILRTLILLGLLSSSVLATDKIQTILVTIPVFHTWDEGEVKLAKIPYTGWDIDNPYISCAYYSIPRVVFKTQKHLKQDINLISVYKLTVDSNLHDGVTHITIRTDKAKKPGGYQLTVDKVVKFAVKAVREDFPDEKRYIIKTSNKPFEPRK